MLLFIEPCFDLISLDLSAQGGFFFLFFAMVFLVGVQGQGDAICRIYCYVYSLDDQLNGVSLQLQQ
jgi:hypothetical protein